MPFRKIEEFNPPKICTHPEHNPPSYIVLQPGVYEHQCPGCGNKIKIVVSPTFHSGSAEVQMCARS